MTFAMAEELHIAQGGKEDKYALLYAQIKSITEGEDDLIANMANIAAMIHETFGFWWTGFYRVIGNELVLGPFQGPLACSRIPFGKGVCGTAWKNAETVIVPDVDAFPGHIACSSASKSEIVVPVFSKDCHSKVNDHDVGCRGTDYSEGNSDSTEKKQASIIAVLDIDSSSYATFDEEDRIWLERIVTTL